MVKAKELLSLSTTFHLMEVWQGAQGRHCRAGLISTCPAHRASHRMIILQTSAFCSVFAMPRRGSCWGSPSTGSTLGFDAPLNFVLVWSLPGSAGSSEVERLAKEAARHADHTTVLIVGVTHDNERLADELLELLTLLRAKVEVDCLFVEYATDLQDEFDRAVKERDVVRVVEAFYLSSKPLFLTAFVSSATTAMLNKPISPACWNAA